MIRPQCDQNTQEQSIRNDFTEGENSEFSSKEHVCLFFDLDSDDLKGEGHAVSTWKSSVTTLEIPSDRIYLHSYGFSGLLPVKNATGLELWLQGVRPDGGSDRASLTADDDVRVGTCVTAHGALLQRHICRSGVKSGFSLSPSPPVLSCFSRPSAPCTYTCVTTWGYPRKELQHLILGLSSVSSLWEERQILASRQKYVWVLCKQLEVWLNTSWTRTRNSESTLFCPRKTWQVFVLWSQFSKMLIWAFLLDRTHQCPKVTDTEQLCSRCLCWFLGPGNC